MSPFHPYLNFIKLVKQVFIISNSAFDSTRKPISDFLCLLFFVLVKFKKKNSAEPLLGHLIIYFKSFCKVVFTR